MMSRRELPSHLQSDTDQGIKRLFLFRNLFFFRRIESYQSKNKGRHFTICKLFLVGGGLVVM